MSRRPPHCDHAPAGACNVPGCPHAASSRPRPDRQPMARCDHEGCTESPSLPQVVTVQGRQVKKWWCFDHAPVMALARPPRVGESPRALAGAISPRAMFGRRQGEDGKDHALGKGAGPFWRPFTFMCEGGEDHGLGGTPERTREAIVTRPPPPVHCRNAAPGDAGKGSGLAFAGSAETRPERDHLGIALAGMEAAQLNETERHVLLWKSTGAMRELIAEMLGLTPGEVKWAIESANRKIRARIAKRRDGWDALDPSERKGG